MGILLIVFSLVAQCMAAPAEFPMKSSKPIKLPPVEQNPFLKGNKPPAPRVKFTPVPAGQRIATQNRKGPAKEVVVDPPAPRVLKAAVPPTAMTLTHLGSGKLKLTWSTRDPKLHLNRRAALAIQIDSDEPLEVEPGVIGWSEWPKDKTEMTLTYTGAQPGVEHRVRGEASYLVCDMNDRNCKRVLSPFWVVFKP